MSIWTVRTSRFDVGIGKSKLGIVFLTAIRTPPPRELHAVTSIDG